MERTEAVRAELAGARERLIAASSVGKAVLDQITVRRSDVERLVEVAASRGERALSEVADRLASRPFGDGIESPEARVAAGKAAHGTLRISCVSHGPGLEVRVEDDGAGVDEAAVHARASALGHDVAQRALLDVLSTPGVSTADAQTVVAGRGVGLGAARQELAHAGYALALDNAPGRGAQFRIALARSLAVPADNENAGAPRERSVR